MRALLIDDDECSLDALSLCLNQSYRNGQGSLEVFRARELDQAKSILEEELIDVAFIDMNLGSLDPTGGLKLLRYIRTQCPACVCIILTGHDDAALIQTCIEDGASDYVVKPFTPTQIALSLTKAKVFTRLLKREQLRSQGNSQAASIVQGMVLTETHSNTLRETLQRLQKLKGTSIPILIRGETGTGKEVMARYISSLENDPHRSFVPVHTGAIHESLLASELFGHLKGAFTGAIADRVGYFSAADGGDIFLDEIETMPKSVQVMLLRVLQDGVVTPVGAFKGKRVKFRVISATNQDLEAEVRNGNFREDLYYRLKGYEIHLPPLRERVEDIPALIRSKFNVFGASQKTLSNEALEFCVSYSWPGNLRQLEKMISVLTEISDGDVISLEEVQTYLGVERNASLVPVETLPNDLLFYLRATQLNGNYDHLVAQFEKAMIEFALQKNKSVLAASRFLGLNRHALRRRMVEWAHHSDAKVQDSDLKHS